MTRLPRILIRIYWAAGALLAMIVIGTTGFYFGTDTRPSLSDAMYTTLIASGGRR